MRIDEEIVITGSFNFTKSAEDKNADNLLVIKDKATAENISRIGRIMRDIRRHTLVNRSNDNSMKDCYRK